MDKTIFYDENNRMSEEISKTVMLFASVHMRGWFADYYLRNIYNIDYPKKNIHIYWIVNNSTDNTWELLNNFKELHTNEYADITINIWNNPSIGIDERSTEQREKKTYQWLADLRNRGVSECINRKCDYLFSLDSDILVRPNIIKNLMSKEKDYISALIYNGYIVAPDSFWKYPNVLRKEGQYYKHVNNFYTKNKTGLINVDFSGAVFLCSKKALPFLKFDFDKLGEDLPACQSLQKNGFEIFCSCDDYCQHIMGKEYLEQFKNFPNY